MKIPVVKSDDTVSIPAVDNSDSNNGDNDVTMLVDTSATAISHA